MVNGKVDYDLILMGWFVNNVDLNGFLKLILFCDVKYDVINLVNWCNFYFDLLINLVKIMLSKVI